MVQVIKNSSSSQMLSDLSNTVAPVESVPADGAVLPTSFAQQRLWLLDQIDPNNAVYNIPLALRLRGQLNLDGLRAALQTILQRHQPLRSTFGVRDWQPVQIVAKSCEVEMPLVEFSTLSEEQREAEARRWCVQEAQRPFDLTHDLMLRASLLRLGPTEHILFLNMHHIASDDWSITVLSRELGVLYEAFSNGRPSPLPALPMQYADFVASQREWLRGAELGNQLHYWRQQMDGALGMIELRPDRDRPAARSYRGAVAAWALPAALSSALADLSRQEGATLFVTLLAAFQTLLYRYSGQEDIVVGSPIAGRNQTEIEGLIGFFVNILALRSNLSGNPSFRTLLGRTREVAFAAYAHEDLPFEKLVEELQPQRDLSRPPFFQVTFAFQNVPMQPMELAGLVVTPMPVHNGTTKFDLSLHVREGIKGLEAEVEYCTDMFDAETITRLLGHYEALLKGIVANPDERIGQLPLLSRAEQQQMLVEWNNTSTDYPHESCIHELFEAQVERTPEATAVVFGQQRLTYRELNQRANRLAHHLCALGVGPEVLVGICADRSTDMIIGLLGILKAGGAYVPLDPAYPKERLAFMLTDTRAPVLVTQQRLLGNLPHHEGHTVCLDQDWSVIEQESAKNPRTGVKADNLAYVIYTSGSTGQPKGVLLEHRGLCNTATALMRAFDVGPDSRVLQFASLSFDSSVAEIFTTLLAGATLCLAKPEELLGESALINLLREQAISVVTLPPSLLALLPTSDLPALRTLITAGEACSSELVQRWAKGRRFVNAYGPTEVTICATTAPCDDPHRVPPIGRPIANTQVYLLDRQLQPVPVGVAGELYVSGVGLARGYHNRPDLTATRFITAPFGVQPRARLYKTGDRARYLPDGNLEFLGRVDHQVKIRGFRIELGEIESVLRQHVAVEEAVVVAREDAPGDKRIVAYVIPREMDPPTEGELRAFVKQKLPDYVVPSAFVFLKAFPLTPNRKVDRQALPALQENRSEQSKGFVGPRDPLEQQLTKLWEKVLGIEPIGIRDNFFELGGHSLLAVRLFAQVEKLTGKSLPLVTLFQAPTIEQVAAILRHEGWESPWASLVPIKAGGSQPPFYCVHGVGGNILEYLDLAKYMEEDQPFYGLQAIGLDGKRPIQNLTVGQMAAHYIEEIRAFQSHGPYYLGGSSFGGLVAYEMAQQLRAAGEVIGVLALFDTNGPGYPRLLPTTTAWQQKWNWWRDRVSLHWGNLRAGSGREKLTYTRDKAQRWNKQMRWKRQHLWDRIREQVGQVFWPVAIKQARVVGYRAATTYEPKPYPGQVTLFRATEQPRGICPNQTLGWGPLVQGGLKIYSTPGHHGAIVREPRSRVLAQQLTDALHVAQTGKSALRQVMPDESGAAFTAESLEAAFQS